jgi:catechol 2,3-dioxygenase-like lactoylglutathione lyase family enzyme
MMRVMAEKLGRARKPVKASRARRQARNKAGGRLFRLDHGDAGGAVMKLQKTYSALLAGDLAAAEDWYTRLLGRGPDYRPMDSMIEWDLFAQGGLQLVTDDNLAGHGSLFLVVDDVAAERRRLKDLGITLGDDIQGDYSTLAQVRDPDGNQVTLATPPSPYPPA